MPDQLDLDAGQRLRAAVLADSWQWLTTRDTVAVQRAATGILERVPFLRLRLRVPVLSG